MMAIVKNLALENDNLPGLDSPTDNPLNTYNRANAGEPNGAVTPAFVGEIVLDTTNNILWKATGTANDTWVQLTAG